MAVSFMKRPKCPFLLLFYILLSLLGQCGVGLAQILDVQFHPGFIHDLKTGETRNVSFRVAYDMSKMERKQMSFKLLAKVQEEKVAKIVDCSSDNFTLVNTIIADGGDEDSESNGDLRGPSYMDFSLTIRGHFIGKTKVTLTVVAQSNSQNAMGVPKMSVAGGNVSNQMDVWVRIGDRTLIAIFVSTLGCLIILANLLMGCQLNLDVVWSVLKRPVAPGIGFCCQFLLMPMVSPVQWRVAVLVPYQYIKSFGGHL